MDILSFSYLINILRKSVRHGGGLHEQTVVLVR